MREMGGPGFAVSSDRRNASDLLAHRVRTAPDHVAFEVRAAGEPVTAAWRQVTTREFEQEVRALAQGFVAAGVQPGESIAVMSPTRYEWALADLAAWYAGAVVVPIYETSAQAQVTAILADAAVRLGIGGSAGHAALLSAGFAESGIDALGVWTMDPAPEGDLVDLVARGAGVPDSVVEERRLLADLDAVATIVYTSGATAAPKGALITHGNLVGKVLSVAAAYTEVVREDGNTIIFLPLAHVLARGLQLICLANGMRIAHLADPREVVPALGALRPTFLVVVPRVLQKIQAAAAAAAAKKHLGGVWAAAQRTAVAWGRHCEAVDADPATPTPLWLGLPRALFDRLFYARLRTLLGGRIDYLLSGAAALDEELSLFFRGLGVPVIEGYGLTETTAPLTGNLPGAIRSGTVGVPLPGAAVRISDQGEVLARGVGVFVGYHNPAEDTEAFSRLVPHRRPWQPRRPGTSDPARPAEGRDRHLGRQDRLAGAVGAARRGRPACRPRSDDRRGQAVPGRTGAPGPRVGPGLGRPRRRHKSCPAAPAHGRRHHPDRRLPPRRCGREGDQRGQRPARPFRTGAPVRPAAGGPQ